MRADDLLLTARLALHTSTMRLIEAGTARPYLIERGLLDADEPAEVCELSGGVSNVVLYVARAAGRGDFVVKQAREKLRVQADWRCGVERVLREIDVLQVCERLLPEAQDTWTATVPRLLHVDADNYLFAMTAAPPHQTWKQQLLAGVVHPEIGNACWGLLARLHAKTWRGAELPASLQDRSFFEALRVDPYYRQIARVHRDLEPVMARLIESVDVNRQSLVHGDFSPKNLLVHARGLVLVDFEVGHFGDPAFDIGFFLTHLALKAIYRGGACEAYLKLIESFVGGYFQTLREVASDEEISDLARRARQNWAACLLARVDGKSPVEYLSEPQRARVRQLARRLLGDDSWDWCDALAAIREPSQR